MRKSALIFVFILLFLPVFLFQNTTIAQALVVGEGKECGVPKGRAEIDRCDSSQQLQCINNICVKQQPDRQCKCQNPNVAASGQNGFTCGSGGAVAFCKNPDEACRPRSDKDEITRASIVDDGRVLGAGKLFGVACEKAADAQCTCADSNKSNVINCKIPGPPEQTGEGICDGGDEVCISGGTMNEDGTQQMGSDANGAFNNRNLVGVHCRDKQAKCTCESPGQTGSGQNKVNCDLNGDKKSTYCDNPDQACQPAPDGSVAPPPTYLDKDLYGNNVELTGFTCAQPKLSPTPTVPPVPPPPCAVPLGNDGTCSAFLTDFGRIDTDIQSFILRAFAILLSISGGIALLLIIKAGYILMTSAGNPDRVKNGREQLIAAIVGLLFIIFSFVILGVINDDLLNIPTFNSSKIAPGPGSNNASCDPNGNNQCAPPFTCRASAGNGRSGTCQL